MDLKECRGKIDAIDEQLVKLFTERMGIAADIAAYKRRNGLPVLNAGREQEILDRMVVAAGPEFAESAQEFFKKLFEISRAYQSKLLADKES